jgi:hypothetical protein
MPHAVKEGLFRYPHHKPCVDCGSRSAASAATAAGPLPPLQSALDGSRCPLSASPRPIVVGALGTSLTWGSDLPHRETEAWPARLQARLRARLGRDDIFVHNGAMRASSADFAALCFDELWGREWQDARGVARPPRLDLAIIEYNWSSSAAQVAALVEALAARGIPSVGVLYYHPVNVHRLGRVKNDQTPDRGASSVGKHANFAKAFADRGVPYVNTSRLNEAFGWRAMLNDAHHPLGRPPLATRPRRRRQPAERCAAQLVGELRARIPPRRRARRRRRRRWKRRRRRRWKRRRRRRRKRRRGQGRGQGRGEGRGLVLLSNRFEPHRHCRRRAHARLALTHAGGPAHTRPRRGRAERLAHSRAAAGARWRPSQQRPLPLPRL